MSDDVTAPLAQPSASGGPQAGQMWARYALIQELGAGGMGAVWAAYDSELERKVALKVLHDDLLARSSQERLRGEARAMARIAHPNVVPVFDVGEHAGRIYYTMELVPGGSIKEWLTTPRPWREVARVFGDAAAGLAALHAAGILHRDVKPGNILLGDDGRARIADLGIAMASVDPDAKAPIVATTTLRHAGTPAYMAPEQLRGGVGNAASDQYALGLALWEALHGRAPFAGQTTETRLAAMAGEPVAVNALPRWLDAAARRAIAVEPAARFPSIDAFARAIAPPPRRAWPWLLAGAAVLALAAGLLLRGRGVDTDAACADAGALPGVWDDAVVQRIAAGFATLHVDYAPATLQVLRHAGDRYAAEWKLQAQAACRARLAGESEALAADRTQCLDARRGSLHALATTLATPDVATLRIVGNLVNALPPVADCADAAYLATLATSRNPERERLVEEITAAGLAISSRRAEAPALAQHAVDGASRTRDPQLLATALIARGRAEAMSTDLVRAVDTFARAAATGDAKIKIEAWRRGSTALQQLGRYAEAEQLLGLADAALRANPDPAREAEVVDARGTLLGREGHYDEARVQFEHAIALYAGVYGSDSISQALELNNLATALRHLDRLPDALTALMRARELDSALGEHPTVAGDDRAIAVVLDELGRLPEARDALLHARAIISKSTTDNLELAAIDADLAVTESRLGHADAALAAMREAVDLYAAIAPKAKETLSARARLATLRLGVGDTVGVVEDLRSVLAAEIELLGPTHPAVGLSHVQLGNALLATGDPAAAVAELARAIEIFESSGHHESDLASALADEAEAERARNRFAPALALDERADAIRTKVLPAGHPALHDGDLARAKDELGLGHRDRAVASATAALAYFATTDRVAQTIDAKWTLGQALGRSDRGRALVTEARDALRISPLHPERDRMLAAIEAWLAH